MMKNIKYIIIYVLLLPLSLAAQQRMVFPFDITVLEPATKYLGGSTGAYLVDYKGTHFIEKRGNSIGHILNEYYTNKAYQALGVRVPDVHLYWHNDELVMLSEFIPGTTLSQFRKKATTKEKNEVFKKLQENFVADALLANWDVIGLSFDNIIVDPQMRPWRVDNGSGLMYRAQGASKGKAWSPEVTEINTMRNPSINYSAATVFGTITEKEIAQQVKRILEKKEALLESLPANYHPLMQKRLDYLAHLYVPNYTLNPESLIDTLKTKEIH